MPMFSGATPPATGASVPPPYFCSDLNRNPGVVFVFRPGLVIAAFEYEVFDADVFGCDTAGNWGQCSSTILLFEGGRNRRIQFHCVCLRIDRGENTVPDQVMRPRSPVQPL